MIMPSPAGAVEVGQVITLKITGIGSGGDHFGRYKGLVIFVRDKGLKMDQEVKVRVTEIKQRCAFAELEQI